LFADIEQGGLGVIRSDDLQADRQSIDEGDWDRCRR
jgi:hypothetical protein